VYDQTVLVWVNQVLAAAVPCDMLAVDELGPLEFEFSQGWSAGLTALDSRNYRVGLVTIRPELLSAARSRWHFAGVVDMDSPESFLDPLQTQPGQKNSSAE
jgi:nucleoside-triphosphatase THEP1